MATLIIVVLFVLAIAILVAVVKFVAGLLFFILGIVIAVYLWNRYIRDPRSRTSIHQT